MRVMGCFVMQKSRPVDKIPKNKSLTSLALLKGMIVCSEDDIVADLGTEKYKIFLIMSSLTVGGSTEPEDSVFE